MYIWDDKKADYRYDYGKIKDDLNYAIQKNDKATFTEIMQYFASIDLFFLLYFVCNRIDVNHPWIVDRCYEVQETHDNTLDLWSRYHYKSTIITFAQTLQDMINFPEESNVIFSHTRTIAKSFLREIKTELQKNSMLHYCWPGIFWQIPEKEAPTWSEDLGLVNKRKINRKELTLEAWGLVDGMPTSKHYNRRIYDDLVTEKSITTTDQMDKLKDAWEKSLNLKDRAGSLRMCGTYYHYGDLYNHIKELGVYKVREHPATDTGEHEGTPVFLNRDELDMILREQGPFNYACQLLLNPVASDKRMFEMNWIQTYRKLPKVNKYIIVDPADSKKKKNDYTVMIVVGVDQNRHYFVVDMIRDKLNLAERWNALRNLREKHMPVLNVYYEKYGKDAEIFYMKEKMKEEGFYFRIEELGGIVSKYERIRTLQAPFNNGEMWFPLVLYYKMKKGERIELVDTFIKNEFSKYPYSKHDDMLDCLARIKDPKFVARTPKGEARKVPTVKAVWNPLESQVQDIDWMAL